MTFGEKLKETRKAAGFSQEELAEKLNVSRQAITKWETDTGLPDISNIMTISKLFSIPVDDLISEEKTAVRVKSRLYESITEYDIDGKKNFDIKLGGAKEIIVSGIGPVAKTDTEAATSANAETKTGVGTEAATETTTSAETEGEKIKIILSSDTISTLQKDFKTKIDDIKGRIDIDVNRAKNISESAAKEALYIEIILPNKYIREVELTGFCKKITVKNLTCASLEFDGRTDDVLVDGFDGTFEIDCNLDMNLEINSFQGAVEVNQVKATSRMTVNPAQDFKKVVKGIGTAVMFEQNNLPAEDFSNESSSNVIEFNGIKSELIISHK